jgi:tRNA-2-methylthio-N6-dimethylallyladenosine synthase
MKKIKFITSYSYIFSPRPGTPASELDLVDKTEAKKRLLFFQSLSDEIRFNYKKGLINTTVNTLFENKVGNNQYFGRDQHLNPVITMSKENIIGQEKKVLIKKFSKQTIYGDIIKSKNHLAA